jgi:hypothetical protein
MLPELGQALPLGP